VPAADEMTVNRLIINGRFLCQRATGVQRVAREFVLALDRMIDRGEFAGLQAVVVAPSAADFSSLALTNIATEHLNGGAGYYWEQVALARRAGQTRLLCLGNTAPLWSLLHHQTAVMLHDQSYRLFPEDYSLSYRTAHGVMGRFIVHRAHPLITVSRTEAGAIRSGNGGKPDDIVVAPNGSWIEDRSVVPTMGGDKGEAFVLHVGGFSQRKNVDGVFAVAVALARQGIAFRLVGQRNERSEEFLKPLDSALRSLITFTGYVDNDELAKLYRDAACLLYPSFYEASGLPPSEAMSFGCPVVVSDLPVLRERCGAAALYCDPHDPDAIAEAVLSVVRDPALAAEMSARGLEQVEQFTWENQVRIVLQAVLAQR
jgi:glycosyltransferase involved in cell wall biosynthesis